MLQKKMQRILFWTLVVLQFNFLHASGWWNVPITIGDVSTPGDQSMFYVGENLTVLCQKYSNFIGEANFTIGNDVAPKIYVTQLNATHAQMVKPVTHEDPEAAICSCCDTGDPAGICPFVRIYTDYPPQNATNLQVVWLDQKSLYFSFDFGGTPYKNNRSVSLDIAAEWSMTGNNSDWTNCSNHLTLEKALQCDPVNFIDKQASLFVRVNATNLKRRDRVSFTFPATAVKDHAKPSPVKIKNITALDSRSVQLTVELELTSDRQYMNYFVTYCRTDNPANCKEIGWTENKTFSLTDLHPRNKYQFKVQAQFDYGIRSDVQQVSVQTLTMPEDAPQAGVRIHPAAYFMQQVPCANQSTVYIYFQDIAEKDKNGVVKNYSASMITAAGVKTFLQMRPEVHTLKLENVLCEETVDVKVLAANDVGTSPYSSLTVHPYGSVANLLTEIKHCDLKVKNDQIDKNLIAEWTPSSESLSYIIFYCEKDGFDPAQCKGDIQYIEAKGSNVREGKVTLPGATVDMKFGMAVMSNTRSSGIVFTNCIYDTSIPAAVKAPEVHTLAQPNFILFSWTAQRCDSNRRSIILAYELIICTVKEELTDCYTFELHGRNNSYKMDDARPYTNYSLEIRAKTSSIQDTWTSSSQVYASLLDPPTYGLAGLKPGEIAGIVIAVLLAVLFLACTVFCILRNKYMQKKTKFSESIGFSIPEHFRPGCEKSHNGDSGDSDFSDLSPTNNDITNNNEKLLNQDSGFHQQSQIDEDKLKENTVDQMTSALPPGYIRVSDATLNLREDPGTQFVPPYGVQIVVGVIHASQTNIGESRAKPSAANSLVFLENRQESGLPPIPAAKTESSENESVPTICGSLNSGDQGVVDYLKVTDYLSDKSSPGDSSSDDTGEESDQAWTPVATRYVSTNPSSLAVEEEDGEESSADGSEEDVNSDLATEEQESSQDSQEDDDHELKCKPASVPSGYVPPPFLTPAVDLVPSADDFENPEAYPAVEPCTQALQGKLVHDDVDDHKQAVALHEAAAHRGYVSHPPISKTPVGDLKGYYIPRPDITDRAAPDSDNSMPSSEEDLDMLEVEHNSACSSSNSSSIGTSSCSSRVKGSSESEVSLFTDNPSVNGCRPVEVSQLLLHRQDSGYISPSLPQAEPRWAPLEGKVQVSTPDRSSCGKAKPSPDSQMGNSGYVGITDLPASLAIGEKNANGYIQIHDK